MEKKTSIFVGLSAWGAEDLVGIIYPKGVKSKDRLPLYSHQFNSVELNSMGYRLPDAETVRKWRESVPATFIFCPKVPQNIYDEKPLGKSIANIKALLDILSEFGNSLGTVLLQMHPSFRANRFEELLAFVKSWDSSIPLQVELRNASFYTDAEVILRTAEALKEYNVGLVFNEAVEKQFGKLPPPLTKTAYIRYFADNLSDMDSINKWSERVSDWIREGIERVYFFAHLKEKRLEPFASNQFIQHLNQLSGYSLKLAEVIQG